jgi:adenylate cyclase
LKQHIVRIALGLVVVLIFVAHAAEIARIGLVTRLDNIIYDARLWFTMPRVQDPRIVILDIDEKSLAVPELGRWPWSRNQLSALVEKLFDKYGLLMLGFDVVFAEPDESSGLKVLDQLANKELRDVPQFRNAFDALRPKLDYDQIFANTLKGRPVVLGYYMNSDVNATESGVLPEPVLPAGTFTGRNVQVLPYRGFGSNIAAIHEGAAGAGHFNPYTDPEDGVNRRVPILADYKGKYYEALSLAMVRLFLGIKEARDNKSNVVTLPEVKPGYPDRVFSKGYTGLEWLDVGPIRIPVDNLVTAQIPYIGPQGSFPYISLADIYFDKVPVEKLRGKIALVGTTAPGLLDLRSTPVGGVYPGVEVHANMIAGMLDGTVKHKPAYMLGAEVTMLLFGGIVLALLLPFLGPLKATLLSLISMILISGLNLVVWVSGGLIMPLAASLLMTVTLFALNMSYGYFVESKSKRQFTELFGQYVPPELVDRMAEDPEKYSMEPRAADLSILFSDVRGFTSISEALTPEDLREYINDYLTSMSTIIRSGYRGTLDKYIGDAIMAFWGAPVDDPAHARNGVLAAMEMQKNCEILNVRFREKGWPTLKIGVGVNSGPVRVGDMGSQIRRAYTVMGDAVNVASRLEGRTKYYGVGILVGEVTKNLVQDVVFKEIDRIKVKGKDEALTIYEPVGMEGELEKSKLDELKLWTQTLRAYRAQQWDQVEVQLLNLQRMNPECHLYTHYADEVAKWRRNPPPANWDGVTVFDEK